METPSSETPARPPVPLGRAWLHQAHDPRGGRMLYPGPALTDLKAFFEEVTAAESVVYLPYLGVWDRHGRPVYAGDLVVYFDEPPVAAVEVRRNEPVIGLARHDVPDSSVCGADFVPRRLYDVLQLSDGELEILLDTDGGDHTRRLERWRRYVCFWRDEHGYDGGEVLWQRTAVLGNPFEHPEHLWDWGLDLDLEFFLQQI